MKSFNTICITSAITICILCVLSLCVSRQSLTIVNKFADMIALQYEAECEAYDTIRNANEDFDGCVEYKGYKIYVKVDGGVIMEWQLARDNNDNKINVWKGGSQ